VRRSQSDGLTGCAVALRGTAIPVSLIAQTAVTLTVLEEWFHMWVLVVRTVYPTVCRNSFMN
jgi:hypothetical protein